MTAELIAESPVAKFGTYIDTIEKGLKKSLSTKNLAKVAKGLDDIELFRKGLGELPIAKGSAPKKLSFSQYMKMQGTLLERFMALVMEFLPLLTATEEAEPPSAQQQADPAVDMAKSIETAVAKSTEGLFKNLNEQLNSMLDQRLAPVSDQLTAIAKSRDAGNGLPEGTKPTAGEDADDAPIPFTSLTQRMREKGQIPKAP
jgi:hypothetical protein